MPRQLLDESDVFEVKETDLDAAVPLDADTRYYLRALSVEQARKIFNAHTRRTRRDGERRDDMKIHDASLDYVLVRWNVTDNGQPAPCDLAHKKRLPAPIQAALIDRAQMGAGEAADEEASEDDTADSFRQSA